MEDDIASAGVKPAGWPGQGMLSSTCHLSCHEDGTARELLDKLVQLVGVIIAGQEIDILACINDAIYVDV